MVQRLRHSFLLVVLSFVSVAGLLGWVHIAPAPAAFHQHFGIHMSHQIADGGDPLYNCLPPPKICI